MGVDGTETTIDSDTYALREPDAKRPRMVALTGATWPNATELRITFRAGYADQTGSPQEDASVVPQRFKQAIMLWVKGNYNEDEDCMRAAKALLKPLRTYSGFA